MYIDNYSKETSTLFSYADGYCSVFPKGLEKYFKTGDGELIIEDDYIVVIKNETPDSIKNKFLKDYAKYHKKEKDRENSGNYDN